MLGHVVQGHLHDGTDHHVLLPPLPTNKGIKTSLALFIMFAKTHISLVLSSNPQSALDILTDKLDHVSTNLTNCHDPFLKMGQTLHQLVEDGQDQGPQMP